MESRYVSLCSSFVYFYELSPRLRLVECGHTFCQFCICNWFNTSFRFKPQTPQQLFSQHGTTVREAQLLIQEHRSRKSERVYSCPTCRAVVKARPVEVFLLKDIVGRIAEMRGEKAPKEVNTKGVWDKYFNN